MLFCPALDSWAQTAMRYPCKPPLAIVPAQSAHRLRQLLWSYHWHWQTTFQSYHLVKRFGIKRRWKLLEGGVEWVLHISASQTSWRIMFNDQGMLSVNSTRGLKVFWCHRRGGGIWQALERIGSAFSWLSIKIQTSYWKSALSVRFLFDISR